MERIGTYEWTVVLLGMGTVFVALIGLSWILSGFSFVARIRSGKTERAKKAGASAQAAPSQASPAASPSGVNPELVAVITAAVSAARGVKSTDFRIAHITPSSPGISGINTPVWGYANRLTSSRR